MTPEEPSSRVSRLPRVSVIGSGTHPHEERAVPLGAALAREGAHLVTGGGPGVMEAVARGFTGVPGRTGLSVGILPEGPPAGYPNPWVELPVATHLPDRGERGAERGSRNHLVVLTATAVVALPGRAGTRSEVELALRYGRPVVGHWADEGEMDGIPPGVPRAPSLEEVLAFVRRHAV